MFIICMDEGAASGASVWKKYVGKKNGRYFWQMDFAIALCKEGLEEDANGAERPAWSRQLALIPCACKKCYDCDAGRTCGVQTP